MSRGLLTLTIALTLLMVTAAVNLQVPLYPTYAEEAGAGATLMSGVFAVYVLGLIPPLIWLGGLSDRIGRKPVVVLGLLCAAVASFLLIILPNLGALAVARVFQGISVAVGLAAAAAWIADIWGPDVGPGRAASVTAAATSLGFGIGALLTSGAIWASPDAATPVSYFAVVGVCLALAIVLWVTGGRTAPTPAAPLVSLPSFPPGSILPALAFVLGLSVSGIVIAIVPSQLADHDQEAWSGLALFLVNASGLAVMTHAAKTRPETALILGLCLLPPGAGILFVGAHIGWLSLTFLGAAISGMATYGYIYRGGLALVGLLAKDSKPRAISGFLVIGYLGFSLVPVVVGAAADAISLPIALIGFCGALTLCCVLTAVFQGRATPAT